MKVRGIAMAGKHGVPALNMDSLGYYLLRM